jgi:hypothetical protein
MTACLTMLLWVSVAADQPAAAWQVWTVTDTRRLLRDEPAGAEVAVKLAAARGEWESFQILVRSGTPITGVTVEPGDLAGPEGTRIPAAEARLYRQHPMEMTLGTYRNDEFRPGWYPDGLIPFTHPLTGDALPADARLKAAPFDLPADQTHGFWVDLHVPRDSPPGEYRGAYRVTAGDGRAVEVPVLLEVWDFALPEVPAMQTALGSPAQRMRDYYRTRAREGKEPEPADWDAVEAQCAEMVARHRINATPPPGSFQPVARPDGSFEVPDEQIEAFRAFIDRYHINAYQTPHPRSVVSDPVEQNERLRAWLAAWDRAAGKLDRPHVVFYTYLRDEPNDEEAYRYVQHWGKAICQADSVVKVLVVEQTWTQDEAWGDLYGSVDIWCPLFPLFRPESAAQRQALGETVWTYTALCQGRQPSPWWHIDYPLLNYRVPCWISWRYRIRGLLYWGGMSFWRQVEDPWTDPKTLDRRVEGRGPLFNGEGTLVYPGRACGYDGIAPSLRLKALRDGLEDYDYLAILEAQGRAAEAEKIILPLCASWFEWEPDPAAYQAARRRLAELILADK